MKSTMKNFGIIVMIAVIGMMFMGCPTDGGPGGGAFVSTTNNSIANNETTLGLEGTAVTASPQGVVTVAITNGKIVITSVSSGTATITVTDGTNNATIAVTVSATGVITIGTITKYIPGAVPGTLTITGLNSYEGYVWANSGTTGQEEPEFVSLWAGEDYDMTEMTATAVEISNGSVALNVWEIILENEQVVDYEPYTGDHQNIAFTVMICNSHDIQFDDPEAESIVAQGFVTVDFNGGDAEGEFMLYEP